MFLFISSITRPHKLYTPNKSFTHSHSYYLSIYQPNPLIHELIKIMNFIVKIMNGKIREFCDLVKKFTKWNVAFGKNISNIFF